jgi:hypothetical protein
MQKPSWVRPPSFYEQDAVFSLSVAFEDPDSTKSKVLLAERHLYIFGTRATVKKWKYCQPNKDKSKTSTTMHPQGGDSTDEQDIELTPQPQPPSTFSRATPSQASKTLATATDATAHAPSCPPRSATIKACNVIKEAAEGDLDH